MIKNWKINSVSHIYSILEFIFDMIWLNVLTLIMCLPILTLGSSVVALYETSEKVLFKREGYVNKVFFNSFKKNFKKSTASWVILGCAIVLVQWNAGIFEALFNGSIRFLFVAFYLLLMLFLTSTLIYLFPILAKFDMEFGWNVRLAFFMTFKYFFTTCIGLLILAICLILVFYFPLMLFLLPSLYVMLMYRIIDSKMKLHMC